MTPRHSIDFALRRYLDEQAAASAGPITSPGDARQRMQRQLAERLAEGIPGLPNGVKTEDHYLPGDRHGLRVRVYVPPVAAAHSAHALPVLVYLHGGGWAAGSIETHDPFCRLLAPLAGVSMVSVDYRLAPESPHPAALEDAHAAVLWTAAHAGSWGADPARLALGGDSAGGHLAAVTANRLAVERDTPKPAALALLYPVTDYPQGQSRSYGQNAIGYGLEADTMRWYWQQYAAGASPDDPTLSPLRLQPLPPLPPTLVMTAEYDVLRDEGIAYAQKLAGAGVAVTHGHSPDMHHNFPVGPGTVARFPQSDRAVGEIAAFLRSTLRTVR